MNLDIGPIFTALLRHRAGALLVVLQVAVALAVLANGIWIVHQRIETVERPTGIDVENIFVVSSASFRDHFNYDASLREDLAYLRGLPGVVAASPADAVSFSQIGSTSGVWTNPDQKGSPEELTAISMDEEGLKALGAHLVLGRDFRADEIGPPVTLSNMTEFVPEIILTQATADSLFPRQTALGKTIYDSVGKPAVIIGIMDNIIGSATKGLDKADRVALYPRLPEVHHLFYVVRAVPGARDRLMAAAESHLASLNPDRVIKFVRPLERFKRRLYLADSNMAIFLITAVALVLLTTCLGIYGLATFNVSTRTRQIGIRRALGARKSDIARYFLVENGLLSIAGILLGCGCALAVGYWLSAAYGLPPLNLVYLAGSVPFLWGIGLLAALHPALRAAAVAPSVATRTI
jgi:putative ABC transport system permease protein